MATLKRNIEKQLYSAAKQLVEERYPLGWGGAAAIRIENGTILTSVSPEVENDALSLCMEVGALLEANKLNKAVTHSLCIYRESETSEYNILTPCGICQERLITWGHDVQVAITNSENILHFLSLSQLMPHHWSKVNGKQQQ
ncbi:MAG: cytidine deaminase [Cellvibrionaceae bacterium]